MGMFRFWSSDSRGSDKTLDVASMPAFVKPLHPIELNGNPRLSSTTGRPLKRRKAVHDSPSCAQDPLPPPKRQRVADSAVVNMLPPAPLAERRDDIVPEVKPPSQPSRAANKDIERARDTISFQFGLEILLKHDELRLIDQELGKCQVALEQLRRCHLIPYPINCPTPEQMLDISNGTGPALRQSANEPVPQWAAPFGVVDGPYARHYAKWLIPDPKFDGLQPEWQMPHDGTRSKTSAEGRSTRNSYGEMGAAFAKPRPGRALSSQKLQSLSNGYPTPKDKAGPCILKRSDGQTVKLVCLDCHRENFSSTQGFINHCRIAHRRDFKSHEEAAVQSGHPIEVNENGSVVAGGEDKAASGPSSGMAHPLTRKEPEDVYSTLLSRIQKTLDEYYGGKIPAVMPSTPTTGADSISSKPPTTFIGAHETPNLTAFLQGKNIGGNLKELVDEAKQQDDDDMSSSEESETEQPTGSVGQKDAALLSAARTPGIIRMPARTTMSPAPLGVGVAGARPTSSKGRAPPGLLPIATPELVGSIAGRLHQHEHHDSSSTSSGSHHAASDDEAMDDADLSPNTLVSNNAPSLVSDDGEYSDSDEGSESESENSADEDNVEAESVSDVAEITIEEDHEAHHNHRSLRHHRGSTGAATVTGVRLKRDEPKHVSFVSPIKETTSGRRKLRRV